MDGNGRWAKLRGKERVYGHFEGVESVRAVMEASVEWGIRYVSFFAFSEENWARPEQEVMTLMQLMLDAMVKELETFKKNGVRFRVLGNRERLSGGLRREIEACEAMTADNTTLDLIVFMSYSGQWDIFQAARRMALGILRRSDSIETAEKALLASTPGDFHDCLVTADIPDPDLIVRTSGESRISNYLLWQAAYSEWLFTDTLWPDFRREEFIRALENYAARDRRFGKIK